MATRTLLETEPYLKVLSCGFLSVALIAVDVAPASSQPSLTEEELERTSRAIALDATKMGWVRWSPKAFPLRVAFASGASLQATRCTDQWRGKYEEYVKFINGQQKLLLSTSVSNPVDAFVFFGSVSELHALPSYRLQETWMAKTGVSALVQTLDRYGHSYDVAYGTANIVEFSSAFREPTIDSLFQCNGDHSASFVGSALIPTYSAIVRAQSERLFGENIPATLEWRVQRRLLGAMTRLSDRDMDSRLVQPSMREALSSQ